MKSTRTIIFLWILVILVPAVCVLIGDWIESTVRNRSILLLTEPNIFAIQFVLAAFPFLLLAIIGTIRSVKKTAPEFWRRSRIASYCGIIISGLIWGSKYYDAIFRKTGGANIGLGILLLASPLFVGLAMYVGFKFSKRKGNEPV